jgi:hypothetical protein
MKIAVIGGTGKEGRGLVLRLAAADESDQIIIGSRSLEKAQASAAEFEQKIGKRNIIGLENRAAAREAELVILCVPYAAHGSTLSEIADEVRGKILVDTTVPLDPQSPTRLKRSSDLSAAEEAQAMLGDSVKVVSTFQNVSSSVLKDHTAALDCDLLVCGDDTPAKAAVIEILKRMGMRGVDAGRLRFTRVVEDLTPLLISINIRYKSKWAGVRVTGIEPG